MPSSLRSTRQVSGAGSNTTPGYLLPLRLSTRWFSVTEDDVTEESNLKRFRRRAAEELLLAEREDEDDCEEEGNVYSRYDEAIAAQLVSAGSEARGDHAFLDTAWRIFGDEEARRESLNSRAAGILAACGGLLAIVLAAGLT